MILFGMLPNDKEVFFEVNNLDEFFSLKDSDLISAQTRVNQFEDSLESVKFQKGEFSLMVIQP